MIGITRDFKALKLLIPAVNELVKLPAAMRSLAGTVKDAEQQTAALNLAVAKLEGSASSKTTKSGAAPKKQETLAIDGNLKDKMDDTEEVVEDLESDAEDGDPFDPSSSSGPSRSPSPRRGSKSHRAHNP